MTDEQPIHYAQYLELIKRMTSISVRLNDIESIIGGTKKKWRDEVDLRLAKLEAPVACPPHDFLYTVCRKCGQDEPEDEHLSICSSAAPITDKPCHKRIAPEDYYKSSPALVGLEWNMEFKPIMQNKFNPGNCLNACIASITGKNINEIPDLSCFSGIEWWDALYAWCIENNFGLFLIEEANPLLVLNYLGIGACKIKESEELHAVVMRYSLESKGETWKWKGEIVHDPNPNPPTKLKFEYHIFIIPKFGSPAKRVPTEDNINDYLYELAHNEYGDAQAKYDLSLHSERQVIAKHLHALFTQEEDKC